MICGVIEGVFQTLHYEVVCTFIHDTLHGDNTNTIQLEMKGRTMEAMSDAFQT